MLDRPDRIGAARADAMADFPAAILNKFHRSFLRDSALKSAALQVFRRPATDEPPG
jgi:hypothetical protein